LSAKVSKPHQINVVLNMVAVQQQPYIMSDPSTAGNARWSVDGKTLYLDSKKIIVSRFQGMVHDVVAEAEGILWSELMQRTERFTIELDKVIDDVSSTKRGVSFVNSNSSNGLDGGLRLMLEWAVKSELRSANKVWREPQVGRYLRRVDAFLELLLFLVHTTGGQPVRGTETMTIRHRNGISQGRSVFVVDGQVVFITHYDKPHWPKVVPRFLPACVGQLLAVYLVHVQPFCELLTVQVLGGKLTDDLWADACGPWGSERLGRVLARETGAKLGAELDVRGYRRAAVSMGRKFIGEAFAPECQYNVSDEDESPR
jgi:hypothetical protein